MSLPAQDDRPVSMFDVAVQLAVLTEKVTALERKGTSATGNISLIISALVLLITFGSKITWN